MEAPSRDEFETEEEYDEMQSRFDDYCDTKIEEAKERRAGLDMINPNTEKVLHDLNEELESDNG